MTRAVIMMHGRTGRELVGIRADATAEAQAEPEQCGSKKKIEFHRRWSLGCKARFAPCGSLPGRSACAECLPAAPSLGFPSFRAFSRTKSDNTSPASCTPKVARCTPKWNPWRLDLADPDVDYGAHLRQPAAMKRLGWFSLGVMLGVTGCLPHPPHPPRPPLPGHPPRAPGLPGPAGLPRPPSPF